MSDLGTASLIVGAIVWLALGGWAFADLVKGSKPEQGAPLLAFCILLAPFAAGITLRVPPHPSESEKVK